MLLMLNNRLRSEKEQAEIPRLSTLLEPVKEKPKEMDAEAVKSQIRAKFKALRKGGNKE